MPNDRPTARRTLRLLALAVAAVTGSGCSSTLGTKPGEKTFRQKVSDSLKSALNSSYHDPDADDKLSRADELFAAEQYKAAQRIYGDLADNTYNAAQMTEKARFLEGECCRLRKRLPEAVATYNRYLQDFPGGVYSQQAAERMYAVAEVWLEDSLRDIEAERTGKAWVKLPRMPNMTDSTRPTLDEEGELVKTFENISVGAPNAPCAEKAMFWAGYLHYVRGRYEDADHFFSTLADLKKDSPLRQEAVRYAIDAKNRVVGGPYYDPQKSNEALQQVHALEATDPQYRNDPAKQEWVSKQKQTIRGNQAEHDFETAEYYRRTNRYGAAYFCYELVKRRYPGTRYSDVAAKRVEEMKQVQAEREADKAAGKVRPLEALQDGMDRLLGNKPKPEGEPTAEPTATRPAGRAAPIVPAGGFDR